MSNPQLVLLFSGKRKSGKDYITENIFNALGKDICEIVRISQPIKAHWAKRENLDLNELLSDGAYKENYRRDMIVWSESVHNEDYGYFCRAACANLIKPVCIVSDVRRKTDLQWFRENYDSRIKTIRVMATDDVRIARGWKFTAGIDDLASECNLDDVQTWDFILDNNNTITSSEALIQPVLQCIQKAVKAKD